MTVLSVSYIFFFDASLLHFKRMKIFIYLTKKSTAFLFFFLLLLLGQFFGGDLNRDKTNLIKCFTSLPVCSPLMPMQFFQKQPQYLLYSWRWSANERF